MSTSFGGKSTVRARYDAMNVLLISWEHDNLGVIKEITDLQHVFKPFTTIAPRSSAFQAVGLTTLWQRDLPISSINTKLRNICLLCIIGDMDT